MDEFERAGSSPATCALPGGAPRTQLSPPGRLLIDVTAELMGDPSARDCRPPTPAEMLAADNQIGPRFGRRRPGRSLTATMPLASLMIGQTIPRLTGDEAHAARCWLLRRGKRAIVRSVNTTDGLRFTLTRTE